MRTINHLRLALFIGFLVVGLGGVAPGQEAPPEQTSDPPPPPAAAETPPEAAAQPGTAEPASEEPRIPRQPSADEIIREFQKQRPKAVPVLPSGGEDEVNVRTDLADGDDTPGGRPRLPDGYMLMDRSGRIVQEGVWWTFVFEADSPTHPEPPMKLLPNQTLERMVRESRGGLEPVVFIVTGEVTDFRSENYLLPRKVLRKRDLGNLKQ